MPIQSLTARYIFPVAGPPLPNGVIVIDNDKVSAVHPKGIQTADIDLGNVAILPGLVNAHTHLDLTGLRGKCPPTPDFTQWLRGIIAHRRIQTPKNIINDIHQGLQECLAAGTTLLGDIATAGQSWNMLSSASLRAVVFHELLGLPSQRAELVWEDAQRLQRKRPNTPTCRGAFSPHAPYSVNIGLIRNVAWNGHMLALHLAETREELTLLANQTGPFREFLMELGVWDPGGLAGDMDEILRRCRPSAHALFIHANYLPADAPIPSNATVVYCPRTHAAFGHEPHPFRELLQRCVRVALGTDSLASNPDLDMLAEMRFVHRQHPDFPGNALLRMGTLSGAEALGWDDETGSLVAGKSADLVVVPLENEEGNPSSLLFKSPHKVSRTMFRGQWTSTSDHQVE